MIHGFPIDYVRTALDQVLLEQHIKNPNFLGGENQVFICSLYEQLLKGDDIDRYVDKVRDITDQQNRTNLILNGVILAPENPTITNLYSCTVIPLSWLCSLRCTLANRDQALETINNLIEELKGAKCDIACLKRVDDKAFAYTPFVVGTIGHNEGKPKVKDGDFIGDIVNAAYEVFIKFRSLADDDIDIGIGPHWLYCGHENKLKVLYKVASEEHQYLDDPIILSAQRINGKIKVRAKFQTEEGDLTELPYVYESGEGTIQVVKTDENYVDIDCTWQMVDAFIENGHACFVIDCVANDTVGSDYADVEWVDITIYDATYQFLENDSQHPNIIFPPQHESFEKWKVSLSFEAIRCDEPYTLNSEEVIRISIGGSATIQNGSVMLGNDLVKVEISKYGIKAETPIVFSNPTKYYLEPLEMPSGNNPNTRINQLVSNNFKTNTQTDAVTVTLQYSFVMDKAIPILKEWFRYGRYGRTAIATNNGTPIENGTITPNLLYNVVEYWSSWGEIEKEPVKTRIANSTDIDDTEGDTLTIGVVMQVQGDND